MKRGRCRSVKRPNGVDPRGALRGDDGPRWCWRWCCDGRCQLVPSSPAAGRSGVGEGHRQWKWVGWSRWTGGSEVCSAVPVVAAGWRIGWPLAWAKLLLCWPQSLCVSGQGQTRGEDAVYSSRLPRHAACRCCWQLETAIVRVVAVVVVADHIPASVHVNECFRGVWLLLAAFDPTTLTNTLPHYSSLYPLLPALTAVHIIVLPVTCVTLPVAKLSHRRIAAPAQGPQSIWPARVTSVTRSLTT